MTFFCLFFLQGVKIPGKQNCYIACVFLFKLSKTAAETRASMHWRIGKGRYWSVNIQGMVGKVPQRSILVLWCTQKQCIKGNCWYAVTGIARWGRHPVDTNTRPRKNLNSANHPYKIDYKSCLRSRKLVGVFQINSANAILLNDWTLDSYCWHISDESDFCGL